MLMITMFSSKVTTMDGTGTYVEVAKPGIPNVYARQYASWYPTTL